MTTHREHKLLQFSIYIKRYANSSASSAETWMIRTSLQLTNFSERNLLINPNKIIYSLYLLMDIFIKIRVKIIVYLVATKITLPIKVRVKKVYEV